jgi:hypothetical protein
MSWFEQSAAHAVNKKTIKKLKMIAESLSLLPPACGTAPHVQQNRFKTI